MRIEWDPGKAKSNLEKHGISFEEAATALSDPVAATGVDPDHSLAEERHVTLGVSERRRLIALFSYRER